MGVVFGSVVAELLEGVAAVVEATDVVGLQLEFVCVDLGVVLVTGQLFDFGAELVGGAVEACDLGVEGVLTMPHSKASRSSASWVPSGVMFATMSWMASPSASVAASASQTSRVSISFSPVLDPGGALSTRHLTRLMCGLRLFPGDRPTPKIRFFSGLRFREVDPESWTPA